MRKGGTEVSHHPVSECISARLWNVYIQRHRSIVVLCSQSSSLVDSFIIPIDQQAIGYSHSYINARPTLITDREWLVRQQWEVNRYHPHPLSRLPFGDVVSIYSFLPVRRFTRILDPAPSCFHMFNSFDYTDTSTQMTTLNQRYRSPQRCGGESRYCNYKSWAPIRRSRR